MLMINDQHPMKRTAWRMATPLAWAALWTLSSVGSAAAQQGYGSYYGQRVTDTSGQAAASPTNYLYDKYFYNRPTVSPYVNLDRLDPLDGTAYQTYVRPQQQARQQQRYSQAVYIDARKKAGNVGDTRLPGAIGGGAANLKPLPKRPQTTSGAYHNHWYGGWAK
jgi:hypothetical protein